VKFRPERLLEDIFTPSWRRVRIPVPGENADFDWRSVRSFALIVDDSLDPSHNQATEIEIDALRAVSGRPDTESLLRLPPEMRPARDGTFDLMLVERPSFLSSRWGWDKLMAARTDKGRIERVIYEHPVWKPRGSYRGFPTTYSGLSECEVVVISALDAQAMDETFQAMLADYVEAGGGLLVVGGYESLGKGLSGNSILAELLPVDTTGPWDLKPVRAPEIRAARPLALKQPLPEGSSVFYVQEVRPRQGAEVWLLAGDESFLTAWQYGQGRVAVISGTVLGGGENAFWAAEGYAEFANGILDWLSSK